jgi:3-hydroxyisobutyrate dehydrogenase
VNIGFIGLGTMGRHMAANLVKAGHAVTIHDLSRDAAGGLEAAGATWADDLAGVANGASIVFTSLPGPLQVESVVLRQDGLLDALAPGSTYVDLSTNSPTLIGRIAEAAAEREVNVVDAPVSGGSTGAEAGSLALYVGGDAQAVESVMPALSAIGSRIVHVGGVGAGNVVKLVNNMVAFVNYAAAAEGLAVAMKAGVDPAHVVESLSSGTGDSWMLRQGITRALRGERLNFGAPLAAKDARLAIDLARECRLPVLLSRLTEAFMTRYETAEHAGSDISDLALQVLRDAGVALPSASA